MNTNPNSDIPQDPGSVTPPTPMVYESEDYAWEYKHVKRSLGKEGPLNEEELNKLGTDGWELVTAFIEPENKVHFYFKRPAEN